MAYSSVLTTDTLNEGRVKINTNFREASVIDPAVNAVSFNVYQNAVGPSTNDKPIEIVNIGYTGHGASDLIHENTTGMVRINGRLQLVRNLQWDQANTKWLTPIQDASAFGSAMLEVGGEAMILHATPSGVNFSDVPHEILMAKASGTDGETNNTIASGYFTQSKACIFARFNNTAYDPAATNNCWNQTAGTDPLLWLSAAQVKNTENEFARFEGNGAGVFGGLFFAQSGGTLGTRTAATTSSIMGTIRSKAHDGTNFQTTGAIDFVSRGTISSGNAGQSIRFLTSATNTAGLTSKFEIFHDGKNVFYAPFRYDYTAINTVPDYTGFAGFSPALSSSSVGLIQQASTSTGGLTFYGMSTTSTASTAVPLFFAGILGATAPTAPAIVFRGMKHNGTTSVADLGATEILLQFRNNSASNIRAEMLGNGNFGIGVTTPTAVVHIAASTTARASLCINPGAAPTSPVNGDIWIDSTAHTMHVRINGVTRSINLT
jgi:hypothetical protein